MTAQFLPQIFISSSTKNPNVLPSLNPKQFYTNLRHAPPASSTSSSPLAPFHRIYYTYLTTFSGYMLNDSERLVLDVLVLVILAVLVWFLVAITTTVAPVLAWALVGEQKEWEMAESVFGNNTSGMRMVVTSVFEDVGTTVGLMDGRGVCTAVGVWG